MENEVRRKSFVFNIKWHETLLEFPAQIRYQVYDAIIEYVIKGKHLVKLDPVAETAFTFIRKELDINLIRYDQTVQKRKEAGRTGGQAKASKDKQNKQKLANASKCKQTVANQAVYDNHYDNDNYHYDNYTPPISPSGGESMSEAQKDFEKFWEMYGKKVGKKKAEPKFLKLSKADREKIFETLPAYIANTPDVNFRKDPLTYLNAEAWNDEIIQRNETRQQSAKSWPTTDHSQYRNPNRSYPTISDF